jgi:hypothetical protein
MTRLLTSLITLGLFCALSSFAYGRITPTVMSQGDFVQQKLVEYHPEDRGATYRTAHDCGDDWLCVTAWATAPCEPIPGHPCKKRRKS